MGKGKRPCPALPMEIWMKIGQYQVPCDLDAMSQVCRTMHTACTHETLFKKHYLQHISSCVPPYLATDVSWRMLYRRSKGLRFSPTLQRHRGVVAMRILGIAGDSVILHEVGNDTIRAYPGGWTCATEEVLGSSDAWEGFVKLAGHCIGFVRRLERRSELVIIDVRTGECSNRVALRHKPDVGKVFGRAMGCGGLVGGRMIYVWEGCIVVAEVHDGTVIGMWDGTVCGGEEGFVGGVLTRRAHEWQVIGFEGKIMHSFCVKEQVEDVCVSRDGKTVAVCMQRGDEVVVWIRMADGKERWESVGLDIARQGMTNMAGNGREVIIRGAESLIRLLCVPHGGFNERVTCSHDVNWAAVVDDMAIMTRHFLGIVSCFDLNAGQCSASIDVNDGIKEAVLVARHSVVAVGMHGDLYEVHFGRFCNSHNSHTCHGVLGLPSAP